MERNNKGQFAPGNRFAAQGGQARARRLSARRRQEIARQGWAAMVDKHFAGDEQAAKAWWGAIGKWASDVSAGYAGTWMQAFSHPGPPAAFLERRTQQQAACRQALAFTLSDLPEQAF
jgi:hypothetical protein